MKVVTLLDQNISQAEFGEIVGVSEARVSQLMADGVMTRGDTAHQWMLAYCERLRDQAAGRLGDGAGGLDLVQERAALAREQRIAQELKNQIAREEYAPVGLLADVLGQASSAVVDRLDQLEGSLRKSCPGIEDDVMNAVMTTVASARNQWIKSTARLVSEVLDGMDDDSDADDIEIDSLATSFASDDGGGDAWSASV